MSAAIAAILAILGPIIGQLLQKWLDSLLNKTAKGVTPSGDTAADSGALLTAALAATPRRQVFRRAFLRHAAAAVPPAVASGTLDPADRKELAALAAAAI